MLAGIDKAFAKSFESFGCRGAVKLDKAKRPAAAAAAPARAVALDVGVGAGAGAGAGDAARAAEELLEDYASRGIDISVSYRYSRCHCFALVACFFIFEYFTVFCCFVIFYSLGYEMQRLTSFTQSGGVRLLLYSLFAFLLIV